MSFSAVLSADHVLAASLGTGGRARKVVSIEICFHAYFQQVTEFRDGTLSRLTEGRGRGIEAWPEVFLCGGGGRVATGRAERRGGRKLLWRRAWPRHRCFLVGRGGLDVQWLPRLPVERPGDYESPLWRGARWQGRREKRGGQWNGGTSTLWKVWKRGEARSFKGGRADAGERGRV